MRRLGLMNSICKPSRSASGAQSIRTYPSFSPAGVPTILAKAKLTTAEAATSDATTNGPLPSETSPGFLAIQALPARPFWVYDELHETGAVHRAPCRGHVRLRRRPVHASHRSLRPDQRNNNLRALELPGSICGRESDIANLGDYAGPCIDTADPYDELAEYLWDNCISSIRVAPGWRAIIYSRKDFQGESLEITADVPNLQLVKGSCDHDGLNDCVTSIKLLAPTVAAR